MDFTYTVLILLLPFLSFILIGLLGTKLNIPYLQLFGKLFFAAPPVLPILNCAILTA